MPQMQTVDGTSNRGIPYALTAVLCTAGVTLVSRHVIRTVDVLVHLTLVFAIGVVMFVGFFAARGDWYAFRPSRRTLSQCGVLGLLDSTSFALYMAGLQRLDAGEAAMVAQSWFVITVVGARVFLGERVGRLGAAGLVAGFLGACMVSGAGEAGMSLGTASILAAGIFSSAGTLLVRVWVTTNQSILLAAYRALFMFLAFVAMSLAFGATWQVSPTATWGWIVLTAAIGPFLNIFARYSALARMSAVRFSIMRSLVPLVVVAGGMLFFGERIAEIQLLGGVLLVLGFVAAALQGQSRSLKSGRRAPNKE